MTVRERRRRRWAGGSRWGGAEAFGVLLVIAGVYWLLSETGLFFWLSWSFLWPLVLIGLGVLLVVSRTGSAGGTQLVSIPREGATQLAVSISVGGGRMRLEGGGTELVEARSTRSDLRSEVRHKDSAAFVRLRQDRLPWGYWGATDWAVRLASDVPSEVRLTAGAGEFELDLSTLWILRASLQVGAASARLVLPRPRGQVEITASTWAASLVIVVPPGVDARVTNSGGLISIDGRTETPGYGGATDRVLVHVTGGASSISIR